MIGLDDVSVTGPVSAVPVPAALPLFASGIGAFGLQSWRRKRKKSDGHHGDRNTRLDFGGATARRSFLLRRSSCCGAWVSCWRFSNVGDNVPMSALVERTW